MNEKQPVEMSDMMRQFQWENTPLGDYHTWPPALRTTARMCMNSKIPTLILWGRELIQIYNDAYRDLIGIQHIHAFGSPAKQVLTEYWSQIEQVLNFVLSKGEFVQHENVKFVVNRKGFPEECYFTTAYTPIKDDSEKTVGIYITTTETTNTINQNRLRQLRNQQLKTVFQQAPVAMCLLRGPQLIIEVANERMLEVWGKSADIINLPLFEGLPDARNQGYEELLMGVFTTGERVTFDEISVTLNRKGRTEDVFVKFVYEALREEDGTISGVMVVADEITNQVKNRRKVEESEARLRMAIDSTKLGTWEYRPLTGELNWSEECKNIYDFPSNQTPTISLFSEHIYPADKDVVESAIEKSMDPSGDGQYNITYRITRFRDKTVRWIKAQGKVYFNHLRQAERFIGTVLDITQEKQSDDTLKQSELRLRLAVEAGGLGTFDWDVANSTLQYSDKLAQMYGFKETTGLLQKDISGRIHPEDQPIRMKAHQEAFENGTLDYEARVVWPDNTLRWIKADGKIVYDENKKPIRMYGTTLDITDQKTKAQQLEKLVRERTAALLKQNEELKISEERYHNMVNEVQDYAIILLDSDGIIENWNKGAEKIKGYQAEEIIGKHFSIFYLPEDQKTNLPIKLLNEAASNRRAYHEGWRVRKDGTKFWGTIVITALHNERDEIIGFSKVTRDLTERKLAEDRMRQYTEELESQNKELEQFAYVASHDLQEPLRKIQTFTEVIQRNLHDESRADAYLNKIRSSANRMSELIKSVLNYSKLDKGESVKEPVDLNKTLSQVISDFELLIEEKHAKITAEKLPVIEGVSLSLNQLFANLIANALKFSDKAPIIEITSSIVNSNEVVNHENVPRDKYIEVRVMDNGIGFDQRYAQQIFGMFQRLHGKHEYAGTGIGLALCKKIIEHHSGFIAAKGEPGKGTTFFVYFPLPDSAN